MTNEEMLKGFLLMALLVAGVTVIASWSDYTFIGGAMLGVWSNIIWREIKKGQKR